MTKKTLWIPLALALAVAAALLAAPDESPRNAGFVTDSGKDAASILARAESLMDEGSYALAHDLYLRLDGMDLGAGDARWVDFRRADSAWRSEAATRSADSSRLDAAREQLETMAAQARREEDRDRVWAEIQESLGDFWWARPESRNWGQGWAFYQAALDWWAGSRDLDLARQRYLQIVWRASRPPAVEPHYVYGYYGNMIPLETLEDALRIARDPEDRSHAQFLIAMSRRGPQGSRAAASRTAAAFEAALQAGRQSQWYDDALFHYAEWLGQAGRVVRDDSGAWRSEPDLPRALELYRRLVAEFRKGETRHFDQATRRIEEITGPDLGVTVSSFFLPGSEIEFFLSWRNVDRVELSLRRTRLASDLRLGPDDSGGQWLQALEPSGPEIHRWSHDTGARDHLPGQAALSMEKKLPAGAYLLEARGGGKTARELVLVTEAAVVLKTTARQALVFFCNVNDGSPRSGADVVLWTRVVENKKWVWRTLSGRTDAQGLAVFDLPEETRTGEIFAVASGADHEAFAAGYSTALRGGEGWKIYASTDRPAYRPAETARWKFTAREYDGSVYSTPAGRALGYEIHDPRGAKVDEGTVTLNGYGSAWGSLALEASMPLGEYRLRLLDGSGGRSIGEAILFRLEEYKLPEFKVSVTTPLENGRRLTFRAGDQVRVEIQAEYFFGGPVAGARTEVFVRQRPYFIGWRPPRRYGWYYEDMPAPTRPWYGGGGGQVVHRETVATDARGRAEITFETPAETTQDFEYVIEARVTDASRREIAASGTVRVSRQSYFVFAEADHSLYRPGDMVGVGFKTIDANEQPVGEAGLVTVTRDRWVEIWLDPSGREVTGKELARARQSHAIFPPPPPAPGGPSWRIKFSGYVHEEILERSVASDEKGDAEIRFEAPREGYYRIAWEGEVASDGDEDPVRGETTVWVADRDSLDLGYHHGGVGIVVDEETARAGSKLAVMLTADFSGAWVLVSVEADDLYSYQVVHMTGTVKLLELEIGDEHIPNFYLDAAMVRDGRIHGDSRQVIVPPERNFLEIEVRADREEYRPGETATLSLTARDHEGRPAAAEVSLGFVDESVYSVQADYAGDPRQFFFGQKRGRQVRTGSSFDIRRFRRPEDERADRDTGDAIGVLREGVPGGVAGGMVSLESGARQLAMGARSEMVAADAMEAKNAAFAPPSPEPGEEPVIEVRSDFRSTAFWQPDVLLGDDGTASVEVTMPDSLTTWKATARAVTAGNRFGIAEGTARTSKPLIARLQAPRFFVEGDTVTISAVVNNNTSSEILARPVLEASGLDLLSPAEADAVPVPAGGEARVDWTASVGPAGPAVLSVKVEGGGHGDAMRRPYTVFAHGIEKLIARSGKARSGDVRVMLDLPAARRPGSTSMIVQVTPSLAVTMLDALPYLIDYPYGCTEQTMSRFLPAVIVTRALERLGMKPADVAGRLFGGVEPDHAGATHPDGREDLGKLDEMVRAGLARLKDFQHSDGGWAWWKDGDSDHFMTSYVVWGLGLARAAGVNIDDGSLRRGAKWIESEIVEEEDDPDLQAWMLHALTSPGVAARPPAGSGPIRAAFDNLWSRRDRLNAYSRALLALAAKHLGDDERAATLARNLANGVQRDDSPDTSVIPGAAPASASGAGTVIGTAHWGREGLYRRWSDGGVESTAFALRALLAIDPDNELIEPAAGWLIKNRRGAQWSNTRDSAIAVMAMTDYLLESGEVAAELEYTVQVNGRRLATGKVSPDTVLDAPARFRVDPAWLVDGSNEIRITRTAGTGPIYFAAEATFFSLEEPVTPAGSEIFARRDYYRIVPRPTLLKGFVPEKIPLGDGGVIASGERVEVVLTIESKNDYEYLVFEDLKPAGLEAVQVRSGEPVHAREIREPAVSRDPLSREPADYTGRSRRVHQELRDRKVAVFVDKLPQGVWEIRYELRAEVPGVFHALPVLGHAMYVPEIRCNGAEIRLTVSD